MKPPERVVHELALEWLAKADVDLSAGRALLAEANLFEVVAFHSQQAVEKSLKAFLVWHQIEFPKTHDVRRLLALCASIDQDLAETLTGAAELTPYGVEYRYPGELAHATVLRRAGARDEAGRPSRRGATMVFCKEAHALSDRHTQV